MEIKNWNQSQHLQKILWSAFLREREAVNHSLTTGHLKDLYIPLLRIKIEGIDLFTVIFLGTITNLHDSLCLLYLSQNPEQKV